MSIDKLSDATFDPWWWEWAPRAPETQSPLPQHVDTVVVGSGYTGMMGAPCANPLCFLGSLFCPQCSACLVRRQSLEEDMSRYSCCQGYYDCMCFKAGSLGESICPDVYNLLESWLCFSCSISATRMLVMDTRDIRPDPCDARLINFSNCLQMLSCICYILSIVMEELEELALLIDFAADIFFALISSCMLAQVNLELKSQPRPANWGKQVKCLDPLCGICARARARMQSDVAYV